MNFKENVLDKLSSLNLEITGPKGNRIARLELITEKDLNNTELIEKITLWREKYKSCFLTEFVPTFERTQRWLNKAVIKNNNRLLFKIITNENLLVGHIGAINRGEYIEYDYYIIGIKVDIKGFALTIARKFLLWILEIGKVDYILGNVRSDNHHAMNFHLRTGFKIGNTIPLKKVIIDDNEFKFEIDRSLENSEVSIVEILAFKADFQKE